jgi:hypothetical protein
MAETVFLNDPEGRVTVECPTNVFGRGFNRQALAGIKPPRPATTVIDVSEPQRCYHQKNTAVRGVMERCPNAAIQDGVQGWLCPIHHEEVKGSPSQLRFEAERQAIADIIAIEKAALKDAKREIVVVSPTEKIIYLVR